MLCFAVFPRLRAFLRTLQISGRLPTSSRLTESSCCHFATFILSSAIAVSIAFSVFAFAVTLTVFSGVVDKRPSGLDKGLVVSIVRLVGPAAILFGAVGAYVGHIVGGRGRHLEVYGFERTYIKLFLVITSVFIVATLFVYLFVPPLGNLLLEVRFLVFVLKLFTDIGYC